MAVVADVSAMSATPVCRDAMEETVSSPECPHCFGIMRDGGPSHDVCRQEAERPDALTTVLQVADQAARWCHGESGLKEMFPILWAHLADLEVALGKLEESNHAP
jgi:hypothetical protein